MTVELAWITKTEYFTSTDCVMRKISLYEQAIVDQHGPERMALRIIRLPGRGLLNAQVSVHPVHGGYVTDIPVLTVLLPNDTEAKKWATEFANGGAMIARRNVLPLYHTEG